MSRSLQTRTNTLNDTHLKDSVCGVYPLARQKANLAVRKHAVRWHWVFYSSALSTATRDQISTFSASEAEHFVGILVDVTFPSVNIPAAEIGLSQI